MGYIYVVLLQAKFTPANRQAVRLGRISSGVVQRVSSLGVTRFTETHVKILVKVIIYKRQKIDNIYIFYACLVDPLFVRLGVH